MSEVLQKTVLNLLSVINNPVSKHHWPYFPDDLSENASSWLPEVKQSLFAFLMGDLCLKSSSQRIDILIDLYAKDMTLDHKL